ncbi:MAG: epimerase [Nitrospinae bacterium RIFCSPLOWO2_12_39_16]|nr:MAG: epimerase [Nitrospinae bacterium RIFCSPLOWO2_12_39_16]
MKLNVLLTGGSGFIGRNILESFLAEKYNIVAPRHAELDLIDDDAVKHFFEKNKIDIVIHSAIKPGHRNVKDSSNLFYADSRMFFNIVRNSALYRKLIVLGSGSVYDMIRQNLPKVDEDSLGESIPVDEHGFFRYVSAKYIELIDNAVELRIFSIFGKYEDYAIRFISNAICKAIFDLPITIKQNRKFDFLYIADLMPILDYFISTDCKYKNYNITPDEAIELYVTAEKVRAISGKDLPIIVGKPGMGLEYSGSNTRLRNEIHGLKLTNIDESMRQLYQWYSENKHTINRDLLLFDK